MEAKCNRKVAFGKYAVKHLPLGHCLKHMEQFMHEA